MAALAQDLRIALRALRRAPTFAAVAVATLALGIGANTAIFAVVDGVLLRPLRYERPESLVLAQTIQRETGRSWATAPPDFATLRERNRSLEGLASFYGRPLNVTGDAEPERVRAMVVSANFFDVLGVRPALGRGFASEEERWGAHRVAVLTDGLWRRRFAADPGVVGRAIRLDGAPTVIVGVLPAAFSFTGAPAQLFLPMAFEPGDNLNTHNNYFLTMVGRLRSGVSRAQALADLDALMRDIERRFPENRGLGVDVVPLRDALVSGARPAILVLMGAVGFVLLIACGNLASLLLAHSVGRRREIAIRAALGAGRGRLVRQFFTEGVLLSGLGGAAGVLLASWGLSAIQRLGPDILPRGDEIRLDAAVLAFALGVTLLTALLVELAPALQGSRVDVHEALTERAPASAAFRHSLRGALVVGEIALSLVLLVGAGLMLKSVGRLLRVDPGFEPRGVLTADLNLPRAAYIDPALEREFSPEATARAERFFDAVLGRVRALAGVRAVGVTSGLPLAGENWGKSLTFYDRPLPSNLRDLPPIQYRTVAGDYFRAAGIRIGRGRAFTERDTLQSPLVAIVNEELVRRYWNGADPIGKVISTNPPLELVPAGTAPASYRGPQKFTVVGVAGDARYGGLDRPPEPLVYVPYAQGAEGTTSMSLIVRAQGDPLALVGPIRAAVAAVDRDQPIANLATLESRVGDSILQPRLVTLVLGAFAAVAALMAALGIYGVMWSSVRQRRAEIGIRMALGAEPRRVVGEVLARGLRLTAAGIGIGLATAVPVSRLLSSLLFGVGPTDAATYAAVVATLAGAAIAACYLPARRAAKFDPAAALRME